MRTLRLAVLGTGAALAFVILTPVVAPAAEPAKAASELDLAFEAASKVAQRGPLDVQLGTQAALTLAEGYVYIPPKESGLLMAAMGNWVGDNLLGMVFPSGDRQEQWFVVIRFVGEGYIRDDDAKDWNADELLQSLKNGTEEMNKERAKRGIAPLEVVGWVERPQYDAASHQLVWSIASKDKGQPATAEQGINYNTYALGRDGYISMNLVTERKLIGQYQAAAKALLAGLHYNEGKRYADFNESTDKVAAYGLAALIGGAAAKKLGLFAVLGVFLAKFWKLLAIAAIAGAGILAKILKKRKAQPTTVA